MIRRTTLKRKSVQEQKIIIAGLKANSEGHTIEEVNLMLAQVDVAIIDPNGVMGGFDPQTPPRMMIENSSQEEQIIQLLLRAIAINKESKSL